MSLSRRSQRYGDGAWSPHPRTISTLSETPIRVKATPDGKENVNGAQLLLFA